MPILMGEKYYFLCTIDYFSMHIGFYIGKGVGSRLGVQGFFFIYLHKLNKIIRKRDMFLVYAPCGILPCSMSRNCFCAWKLFQFAINVFKVSVIPSSPGEYGTM